VTSTDAAANGLDTNAELCGNGTQANSAGFVGPYLPAWWYRSLADAVEIDLGRVQFG